jgi:hypothetical protein
MNSTRARPLAAFCAVVLLAAMLAGCDDSARQQPASTPTTSVASSPTAQAFTFTDWRVAYLGQDGRLHAVSLDGRSDLAGGTLPNLALYGLNVTSAGNTPDGHLLAYSGQSLTVLDAEGYRATHESHGLSSTAMFWSPDGSALALGDGSDAISIVHIPDLTVHPLPPDNRGIANLVGWADATHLAVTAFPSGQSQSGDVAP